MEYTLEVAKKTQAKLDGQIDEFNRLRDRLMIIAGFAIALLTAVFSFWDKINEPYIHFVTAASIISLISIAVLIYSTYSNKLSRGLNTHEIENLFEYGEETGEEFFLNEIAYNLQSFRDNESLLNCLQKRLNWCITVQAIITIAIGIAIFFNGV